MLTVFRNGEGRLIAACEWYCVDEKGWWKPDGKYVCVKRLELNPDQDGVTMVNQMAQEIAWQCPWAIAGFWRSRRSHANGTPKVFGATRDRFLRGLFTTLRKGVGV